jgi:Holliday junction resolvase
MNCQSRGSARERIVAEELRAKGWIVKGTGDAHGAIDLIAVRRGDVRLIQVKGNRDGGPFANFRPTERKLMNEEALRAGFKAWLVYAPPDRQAPRWIPSWTWP